MVRENNSSSHRQIHTIASSLNPIVHQPVRPSLSRWPKIFIALALATLCIGSTVMVWVYHRTVVTTRQEFLSYTRALAAAVTDIDVERLQGIPSERGTVEYERTKQRLMSMRAANPFFRFMYFIGYRDGQWFFYVDSEPVTSTDISLPGDIYAEPTEKKLWSNDASEPFIYGPYQDVWGHWVSAFVPIVDSRGVKRFFGVDINAEVWSETMVQAVAIPAGFTLFFLAIILFFYLFDRQHQRFRERMFNEQYELWRQHERLDLAVRASRDGMFDMVINTGEAYYSARFLEIVGRLQERYRLAPRFSDFLQIIHSEDYDRVVEKMQLHLISGEPFTIDFRVKHRLGDYVWVSGRGSAYMNEFGKPWRFIGFITDITEQKMVERMRNEFVTITSHQLRTPLTAIKWFCSMLVNGDMGELSVQQRDCLREIVESNERMIQLVNDLLLVSRIERGVPLMISPEPFDMRRLITDCADSLTDSARTLNIRIVLDLPDKEVFIRADREKIVEAVRRLMHNALVYSAAGSEVHVRLKTTADELQLSIQDHGIGIARKEQPHMFEKFFRGDEARLKEPGGNGLGLFIVKSYIEAHKGGISFTSRARKGTVFTIVLPLVRM